MPKVIVFLILSSFRFALSAVFLAWTIAPAIAQDVAAEHRVVEILQHRCVKCHNGAVASAGVDLSSFQGRVDVWKQRLVFTKVADMVGRGLMPPPSEAALSASDRTAITDWLSYTLENVDLDLIPVDPGSVPPRRLTRVEYNNTVQDLFGIKSEPGNVFPRDQTIGDSFDNDVTTLTVEPLWFEKAMAAAEETVRAIWADPAALGKLLMTKPSPLPVEESALYALDQKRSQNIDLSRDFTVVARLSGTPGNIFLKSEPGAAFRRGSKEFAASEDSVVYRISRGQQLQAAGVKLADGQPHWIALTVKDDRATIFADGRMLASAPNLSRPDLEGHVLKIGMGQRRRGKDVPPDAQPVYPGLLEVEFYAEALPAEALLALTAGGGSRSREPLLAWQVGMKTPLPENFISVDQARSNVIDAFLAKAFRRPPTEEELSRYNELFQKCLDEGLTFDVALQLPVTAALTSPSFLFRIEETQQTAEQYLVSSVDLASRLSYFLWSGPPDAELAARGREGRLNEADELLRQVDRMLADKRADRFFERFILQWLRTEGLGVTYRPDTDRFPAATDSLLVSMRQESVMVFADLVRQKRSLLRLIRDDSTMVNEELAEFYGYPADNSSEWRRVPVPDSSRGGVITEAAVLTVSSSPERTSPVFRGKWILDVLLGEPPPPPPANVPPLPAEAERTGTSVRELLEAHRSQPACSGCHSRMDPYGLALEQYDAIGRVRPTKLDTSTTLFNGERIDGAADLKNYIIRSKSEAFVRHVTRKMLAYALGRELTFPDERPIELILQSIQPQEYSAKDLIRQIVLSEPFRYRKNP